MIRNKTLRTLGLYPAGLTRSASGAAASFNADQIAPLDSLVVSITPVQSGSGDPSPENVRPISGWTGANIVVSPTLEAADGTTYSASWQADAGTVYRGTPDVTTGVLTVTHEIVQIKELTFTRINTPAAFRAKLNTAKSVSGGQTTALCDSYNLVNLSTSSQWASAPDYSIMVGNLSYSSYEIYIKDSRYTDANVFRAAMGDAHIIYELATPVTYQFDPITVQTLLGRNNIWADTGDVALSWQEGGVGSRSWMLAMLTRQREGRR